MSSIVFNLEEHPLSSDISVTKVSAVPEFKTLWNLRPSTRTEVYCKRLNGGTPAHRFYKSYGIVPTRRETASTYMFSGDGKASRNEIPLELKPVMDFMNQNRSPKEIYNQVVINWYEDGADYTPFHVDCLDGMRNEEVAIVSLVEETKNSRYLVFKPIQKLVANAPPQLWIASQNKMCVSFKNAALTKWRHGFPPSKESVGKRISISFRSYYSRQS